MTPLPDRGIQVLRPHSSQEEIARRTTTATTLASDIGPYCGYAPLGHVFALSQNEIETEALEVTVRSSASRPRGVGTKTSGTNGSSTTSITPIIHTVRIRAPTHSILITPFTR